MSKIKISKYNSEHYCWGDLCDGWHLVKTAELSIIHEKMPAKTSEVRHCHEKANQFFFVLTGQASIEIDGELTLLNEHEGIEVLAKTPHQMMNNSSEPIEFIVISMPNSKGDRVLA